MRRKMRRRGVPRGTIRAPKADWVYRDDSQRNANPFDASDGLGSYSQVYSTLTAGQTTAQAVVLYDSSSYLRSVTSVNAITQLGLLGGEARAAGRRATVHAVEGHLNVIPSTWAVGSVIRFGWRILAGEQEPDDGGIILDIDYTMWLGQATASGGRTAAHYRNQTRCLAEGRLERAFSTSNDQAMSNVRIAWKDRWRLREEEGLFLFLESEGSGVNVRWNPWLRTLVS